MHNLLNKELKLTISPLFYVLPLIMGLLMFIPNWLYFMVLMYYFFMSVPNILSACKAQNDLSFSVLLPVSKDDIVKARIMSFSLVEMLHITASAILAGVNMWIYGDALFFLSPNIAFFGLCFVMYGLFNLILFPIYYKTAYKYGAAVIISISVAFLFAAGAELIALFNRNINVFMRNYSTGHLIVLVLGILFYILSKYVAYKLSIKSFRKVEA
jgi:hypothetical protein